MKRHCRFTVLLLTAAVMMVSCRLATEEADPGADAEAMSAEPVARIGDYTITKGQLKERLAQEIRPQRVESALPKPPVTPETVLRKMVAEKAIMLEGRKLGYLEDEVLSASIERFRQRQFIRLLLTDYVRENIPVTASEIDQTIAADPNLSRERAEMKIQSTKAQPVLEQFYADLLEKFKVEKVRENFAKAIRIHQRLATKPVEPRGRGMFWITNKQIRNELSEEEKQIPLTRYVGGAFTLYDWFKTLGEMAPPGRPKNLNRPEGVEALLDRGLRPVIFAAEAVARGYDKHEELVANVRQREDSMVLGKARSTKYKEVEEPTDEQIRAYFDEHAAHFAQGALLKIEPVWCKDLETAQKVKELLVGGASTASANETYGLRKDLQPYNVYAGSEGLFWDDLWKAEPNAVVGPVKGFYETGIKWRVVKILEKTPPVPQPFSDNMKNQVKSALMSERRDALMAAYEAEMLKKYRHEIYTETIQDMDPLEVTPTPESGQ